MSKPRRVNPPAFWTSAAGRGNWPFASPSGAGIRWAWTSASQCSTGPHPKVNGSPGSVRLTVADSEHLPFATGSFDAVTCANSFHHYPHPKAVVREMLRVLRADGWLLVIDGWPDHWAGRIIYDLVITRVEGGDVRHVESHEMVRLLEGVGFREVTQKRIHALFPLLLTRGIAPGAEPATPR